MPPKGTKRATKARGGAGGPITTASSEDIGTALEQVYFKHFDTNTAKYGPKTAILMEVGKFFEIYDYVHIVSGKPRTNVQTLAELCGCSVEPRPCSNPEYSRLFWGFPLTSLSKFERILVNAGYTVVVIVQKKDATGDVVERPIDHISSPGTFWEHNASGLNIRNEEQCMLGMYIEPYVNSSTRQQHWSIASTAFDIMTGKAVSTETDIVLIDGKPVCDEIQPFWSLYPPAEVVVYWVAGPESPILTTADIEALFPSQRPMIHIVALDPAVESSVQTDRIRLAFLDKVFKHDSALHIAEFLGVTMYHLARRSLYNLLQFIQDHNPSYLVNLHEHTMWTDDERMLLGNAALEQLAMIPSHVDRSHESLLYWLQHAHTSMGRRAIRERCLTPIADIDELNSRQERIAWLQSWDRAADTEVHFRGMYDLPRIYRRFQLGNGTTDDLLQMLTTYTKIAALIDVTRNTMFDAQDFMEHIESVRSQFDEVRIRQSKAQTDAAIVVGSVHPWKRGIFPELDRQEDEWQALETDVMKLKTKLESSIHEPDCITWTLKEDAPFTFTATSRRANTIAAAMKKKEHVDIHVSSRGSTGAQSILTCKELEAANQTAIKLRSTWRQSIDEVWKQWWDTWMHCALEEGILEQFVAWVADLDAELTFARLARQYGYCRPQYVTSLDETPAGVELMNLRHPIIERVHTSTPYVAHSVRLGVFADGTRDAETTPGASPPPAAPAESRGGILLYGVNAAGKSSLGKAIGLTVLMAQCGIPVPASSMKLIPYTRLYTRILGNDNLWAGMSSFVVEMTEFRSILRNANNRTLVIGDELCAGTETASATAIVAAGISTLLRRRTQFVFATHLHELADIPELARSSECAFYHLSVRSDVRNQRLIYDRILKTGCGSPMYGLEVCRGLDMDAEFLTSAFAIRKRMFDADGAPRSSRYNSNVIIDACTVCGSTESLESHHIIPQAAAAADGTIGPGVHKHAERNLTALCDACHKAHHNGMLEIQGWVDTSAGRKLEYKWVSS